MIALDEDMAGSDNTCVIVQGLKACLGLFIRLNNGTLLGAHFTPASPLGVCNVMMTYLANGAGGGTNWAAMVTRFNGWAGSAAGLNDRQQLATYFKNQMGFHGQITYADLYWAPINGYDIRFTDGITPRLEYRPTPVPNAVTNTPLANVSKATGVGPYVMSATNGAHPGAIHNLPNYTGGFAMLSDDLHDM